MIGNHCRRLCMVSVAYLRYVHSTHDRPCKCWESFHPPNHHSQKASDTYHTALPLLKVDSQGIPLSTTSSLVLVFFSFLTCPCGLANNGSFQGIFCFQVIFRDGDISLVLDIQYIDIRYLYFQIYHYSVSWKMRIGASYTCIFFQWIHVLSTVLWRAIGMRNIRVRYPHYEIYIVI